MIRMSYPFAHGCSMPPEFMIVPRHSARAVYRMTPLGAEACSMAFFRCSSRKKPVWVHPDLWQVTWRGGLFSLSYLRTPSLEATSIDKSSPNRLIKSKRLGMRVTILSMTRIRKHRVTGPSQEPATKCDITSRKNKMVSAVSERQRWR